MKFIKALALAFIFLATPVFADEIFLRCVEEGKQTYELNIDREDSRASVTRMKDDGSGIVTNVEMKTTPGEYLFSSNISKINLDRKTLIMVETLHMSGNPGFVIGTNTKQCSLIEVEDNKI